MKRIAMLGAAAWLGLAALVACSGGTETAGGVNPGDECSPEGATAEAADGCNSCSCQDGSWQCTLVACDEPCTTGDIHSNGCNSCSCQDGSWQCTARGCIDDECPPPREPEPDQVCSEAEVVAKHPQTGLCCLYNNGCAPPEGWETFGNQEECLGDGCTPGDVIPAGDGCNTCSCTETGMFSCTRVACVDDCEDGQTRRAEDGCNVCTCSEGVWGCTERACTDEPIACGGILGNTCTDDEYCAYEEGQDCGAADAGATCEPRPETCDTIFEPVCGCDGETHGNACAAAMAGTGVSSSGECES